MRAQSDVIAAIATPPGRGGIGIVRVSGGDLTAIRAGLLRGPLRPREARVAVFRDHDGTPIDRGLTLYFPKPATYTGDDVLELHGHGGPAVMRRLLQRCLDLGARLAEPGEFTQRAFLNGKLDLAQAEAVADLIEASTARAAKAAMQSLSGEFSNEIATLVEELVDLRALIEATLDFPEEEIDVLQEADVTARLARMTERIAHIRVRATQGRLLHDGVTAVIVGAPNVGKSSVMNRLAGDEIAIVTATPGTTRDPVREAIDLDGIPLTLIDTAGLRDTDDEIEQIGIERTRRALNSADVALVVVDASAGDGLDVTEETLALQLPPSLPRIWIGNKIDLIGYSPRAASEDDGERVYASAKTGEGIDLVRAALLRIAGVEPQAENLILARERHLVALALAATHMAAAAERLQHLALELLAEELRLAQQALSQITGEFTADDLLGEIFSRFCLGK